MNSRKKIKLNRIFRNGFAVCVAIDHGFMSDPTDSVKNIGNIAGQIAEGGADGILVSFGQAQILGDVFSSRQAPAMLLRADWMNALRLGRANNLNAVPSTILQHTMVATAEDALELGADAVIVYYVIGYDEDLERQNIINCAALAEKCVIHGLPLIIEPLIIGGKVNGSYDVEMLVDAARIAQELGADILKIPYTGDMHTFKELTECVDIPVLVLGGAKSSREEDGYEMVQEAIDVGAAGVVFGRKIITAKEPKMVVGNIVDLIHNRKTVKDILGHGEKKDFIIRFNRDLCTGCAICVNACRNKWGIPCISLNKKGITYDIRHCTKCGICKTVCQNDAILIDQFITITDQCNLCGECVQACPQNIPHIINDRLIICSYCSGIDECACVQWCPEGALWKEKV